MRMDGKFIKPGTIPEAAIDADLADKTAMLTPAGAATGAAVVLLEGTDNGVQKVTLQGPAALTGDRVIAVPDEDVDLADIAGHIADTVGAHDATAIAFAATGGVHDLASIEVNAAIEELEGEVDVAKALQTGPLTVVAMGDAAHALVVGTAGPGETKIVNNIVVVDAESGEASENLAFPAAADFVGMLFVANSGGENVVLTSAGSQVLLPGEMAIFSSNGTGWAPFGRFVLSGTQYAALKLILAGTVTESAPDLITEYFETPAAAGINNIVAQLAGDVDESDPANITQNAGIFRNAQVVFGGAWDGGNIELDILTVQGTVVTETIVSNPGATVEGVNGIVTVLAVRNTGMFGAGTADVQWGPKLAVRCGGKTPTLAMVYEDTADGNILSGSSMDAHGLVTLPGASLANGAKNFVIAATLATTYSFV